MKRDSRLSNEMPVSAYRMIRERLRVLAELEEWLERPMQWLGLVWLILVVLDLIGPSHQTLQWLAGGLWVLFMFDFMIRFALAPRKSQYLRQNVLTAASLAIPALRIFRLTTVVPAFRVARGLQLVRMVSSINRSISALKGLTTQGGFQYVLFLTVSVILIGAAGIYTFEKDIPGDRGIKNFGTALWWTSMIITTIGSDYWPQSPEGRVLTFLLALYAFAVFGYVTATIARFFSGRDAEEDRTISNDHLLKLEKELGQLRASLEASQTESQN